MADVDKHIKTQIKNIEAHTGKSLDELISIVAKSGITKHMAIVKMLKETFGLGHGHANAVVHFYKKAQEPTEKAAQNPLDNIYVDKKAHMRPIHEALLPFLESLGEHEVAPKMKNISYRRKKQFCLIGPATNTRVEVGLNVKDLEPNERLIPQGPGKMCNYVVKVTDVNEVDEQLKGWIKQAYDAAV